MSGGREYRRKISENFSNYILERRFYLSNLFIHAGRNISNLRYADDSTIMAESEEEPKSFLMKVKEESEKVVLKLNI